MIRAATPEDVPALARVHVASWQAAYRGIVPDAQLDALTVGDAAENWRRNLRTPDRTNLVAEADGQVVGFIAFGPTRSRDMDPVTVAEIYGVYLSPTVWRAGYGRALVEEATRQMRDDGFDEVMLWTWELNQSARDFYERLGFIRDAAVESDRFGPRLTELRYRKCLANPSTGIPA